MEKKQILEINQHISDALKQWAEIVLTADAGNWAYHLNYTNNDIFHAIEICMHVLMNNAIKSGYIENEEDAVGKGFAFREAIEKSFGIDTVKILRSVLSQQNMKYFTLEELTRSDIAKSKGIDNNPVGVELDNLIELTQKVLDPLREAYGKPIYVTSGYRSEELNKEVKGAKNSFHLRGCAADITTYNKNENIKLFKLVQDLKLPFSELINEHDGQWVHIAYDKTQIDYEISHT